MVYRDKYFGWDANFFNYNEAVIHAHYWTCKELFHSHHVYVNVIVCITNYQVSSSHLITIMCYLTFCFNFGSLTLSVQYISATMIFTNNVKCYFSLCDIDIDECEVGTSNCTQICNNNDGGYSCTCYDGYQINDSDNRTCKGITIINDL